MVSVNSMVANDTVNLHNPDILTDSDLSDEPLQQLVVHRRQLVRVWDKKFKFSYKARVIKKSRKDNLIKIHYINFNKRYDEWVKKDRIILQSKDTAKDQSEEQAAAASEEISTNVNSAFVASTASLGLDQEKVQHAEERETEGAMNLVEMEAEIVAENVISCGNHSESGSSERKTSVIEEGSSCEMKVDRSFNQTSDPEPQTSSGDEKEESGSACDLAESSDNAHHKVYNKNGVCIGECTIEPARMCHGIEVPNDKVRILVTAAENEDRPEEFLPGAYMLWERDLLKKVGKRRLQKESFDARRKRMRNLGEQYETRSKEGIKQMPGKQFEDFQCSCRYKECSSLTTKERQKLYQDFWSLGDYDAQNYNLLQRISTEPKKTEKVPSECSTISKRPKQFTRKYILNEKHVCKTVFTKTFGVSSGRVNRLLEKKQKYAITPKDKRGRHGHHPHVSEAIREDLHRFIDKIPKYKSHYKEVSDNRYLSPGVKKIDIYHLWEEECRASSVSYPLPSYEWFLLYWKTHFNLKIHRPSTDCCSTCDELANSNNLKALEKHHKDSKKARDLFKVDASKPHTITFDMEKTLPLPHLHTNKVFYLRQLWLYNLGINHVSEKQGHMHCWTEGTAKRGSNEVGSCLLSFMIDHCQDWEEITMWSDTCGGQNRNNNITALLISLVNSDIIKADTIVHRFMWSGHSYLPNDSDFSHIEKKKNEAISITSPQQYIHLIKTTRKTKAFKTKLMGANDFKKISLLSEHFPRPKLDDDKQPIKMLSVHEMIYKRGLIGFLFRHSFDETTSRKVTLKSTRSRKKYNLLDLPLLYPTGVPISHKKFQNFLELLKYVPPVDHDFYKSLKHDGNLDECLVYPEDDEE